MRGDLIMNKYKIKTKLIKNLECEIKKGNKNAIDEFLFYLEENGAPLIEEIEGDTDNLLVTFIYTSNEPIENVLFSAGFSFCLNNLEENKLEQIQDTNLWYITYRLRNDIRFAYYFLPNDSFKVDCEKRWDNITWDKFNKSKLVHEGETEEDNLITSFFIMPNSEEDFWTKKRIDAPNGNLQEYKFESKNLKEPRKIYCYTPYGYNEEDVPYGFIVLTDAHQYIKMFSVIQVLDNLIADKKIPPIVAILIDSTETRYEELTCNDVFCSIIVDELIPWVKKNFNVSTNPQDAIIAGSSIGGLNASYLGLKHPEVFGNILSQSGSYWYKPENYKADENECWMSSQFKVIDKLPLKFYLNSGILEDKSISNTNFELRDTLIAKGYSVDFEIFKSGHDGLCWGETLAQGLISLIGL